MRQGDVWNVVKGTNGCITTAGGHRSGMLLSALPSEITEPLIMLEVELGHEVLGLRHQPNIVVWME